MGEKEGSKRGLFLSKLWNIHFQVKHLTGTAVKMEGRVSWAAFVHAPNTSSADTVSGMNGKGVEARRKVRVSRVVGMVNAV